MSNVNFKKEKKMMDVIMERVTEREKTTERENFL